MAEAQVVPVPGHEALRVADVGVGERAVDVGWVFVPAGLLPRAVDVAVAVAGEDARRHGVGGGVASGCGVVDGPPHRPRHRSLAVGQLAARLIPLGAHEAALAELGIDLRRIAPVPGSQEGAQREIGFGARCIAAPVASEEAGKRTAVRGRSKRRPYTAARGGQEPLARNRAPARGSRPRCLTQR